MRVAANGPDEDVEGVDVPRSGTADGLSAVTLSRTPSAELGLATVTEESQSWSRKDEQQLQEPEFRPYSKGAERQQAHEWAEAHGRHHTPLHAGRAHVLEEQEHAKSQGGTASETIRPHRMSTAGTEGRGARRVQKVSLSMRHGMKGTLTTFPSAALRPDANPILHRKVIAVPARRAPPPAGLLCGCPDACVCADASPRAGPAFAILVAPAHVHWATQHGGAWRWRGRPVGSQSEW